MSETQAPAPQTEPPRPEPPQSKPRRSKQDHAWNFFTLIMVAILTLMFVVPGFFAGAIFRFTGGWTFYNRHPRASDMVNSFFYPALAVAAVSPPLGHFYQWQYESIAGKIEFDIRPQDLHFKK